MSLALQTGDVCKRETGVRLQGLQDRTAFPAGGTKVRNKSETYLIIALSAFALTGSLAMVLHNVEPVLYIDPIVDPAPITIDPVTVPTVADGATWFQTIRQYCNPVEVETQMRWQPAPDTSEGQMHKAACYALAGKIDQARGVIEGLPADQRYHAAGVVFNAGHPAADAGDELAAGPLMELVVEYWPNHYMALYHAGAAAFERSEYGAAGDYLERFLVEYSVEDGWRSNAKSMLETMTVVSN